MKVKKELPYLEFGGTQYGVTREPIGWHGKTARLVFFFWFVLRREWKQPQRAPGLSPAVPIRCTVRIALCALSAPSPVFFHRLLRTVRMGKAGLRAFPTSCSRPRSLIRFLPMTSHPIPLHPRPFTRSLRYVRSKIHHLVQKRQESSVTVLSSPNGLLRSLAPYETEKVRVRRKLLRSTKYEQLFSLWSPSHLIPFPKEAWPSLVF